MIGSSVAVVMVGVLDLGPCYRVLAMVGEGYGVQVGCGMGVPGCHFLRRPNLAVGR